MVQRYDESGKGAANRRWCVARILGLAPFVTNSDILHIGHTSHARRALRQAFGDPGYRSQTTHSSVSPTCTARCSSGTIAKQFAVASAVRSGRPGSPSGSTR